MLVLSRSEVERLLDIDRLIDNLAPAMKALSFKELSMPPRAVTLIDKHEALMSAMPVYLPSSETLSAKLVTLFPQNLGRGLHTHQALVLVFDAATGSPVAFMDGTSITAIRTAAGSALATRLLANQEASVLALVGTGVQARTHARLCTRVRPIKEIRVLGRAPEKAEQLAAEISEEFYITAKSVASFEEAARGAQVVCAATHTITPIVSGRHLEPGTHVNSVGQNVRGREVDDDAITRSRVFVELREAALTSLPGGANDLAWPIRDGIIKSDHVQAEIGELIAGTKQGRTSPEQITLYKSVGVAVQDAVAARIVLDAARQQGVGTDIETHI